MNNKATAIRWRIMSILVLASFVSYVLRYNMSSAAPVMMADLDLSEIQWGWILAAFNIGYAMFQFPGGIAGDRFGPRKVITIIAVLWALMTVLTALVPGPDTASTVFIIGSLMAARFMVGMFHAPIFPLLNASMVRWFPVGSWGLPQGLSSSGLTLGVAASAPLLAWSIPEYGWRMSFIFLAPLGIIVAILWWWYSRDNPAEHASVNQAEIDLLTNGLDFSVVENEGAREAKGEPGWKRVVRNKNVLMLTASYACMNYVMYIVFNWFFYYLVEVREFSLVDAGFVTSAQWIAGAIGAAAGGWLCDRLCRTYGLNWGCRLPIAIGMIASAVLLLGGAFSPNQTAAMIMLALCFFFNQAVEGPYWATSMAVGGRYAGSAGGLMNTGGNTMGIVNALLVPWLALVFGWEVAVSSGAFFALLGTVLLLFVRPDQPVDAIGQE